MPGKKRVADPGGAEAVSRHGGYSGYHCFCCGRTEERPLAIGAADYLVKPVSKEHLLEAIRRCDGSFGPEKQGGSPAEA